LGCDGVKPIPAMRRTIEMVVTWPKVVLCETRARMVFAEVAVINGPHTLIVRPILGLRNILDQSEKIHVIMKLAQV